MQTMPCTGPKTSGSPGWEAWQGAVGQGGRWRAHRSSHGVRRQFNPQGHHDQRGQGGRSVCRLDGQGQDWEFCGSANVIILAYFINNNNDNNNWNYRVSNCQRIQGAFIILTIIINDISPIVFAIILTIIIKDISPIVLAIILTIII